MPQGRAASRRLLPERAFRPCHEGDDAVTGQWAADRERGDVILGWLTKICVLLAVVGVIGFDTISITSAKLQSTDDANSAASAAYDAWNDSHGNIQTAYNAAAAYADEHGERIPPRTFTIASDGTVTLTLIKEVTTVAVHHIGPLRHLQVIRVQGTATPPTL